MIEVTCPTCHSNFTINSPSPKPRRICTKCGKPISKHHKWFITDQGKIQHRHCDNPVSYLPKSA